MFWQMYKKRVSSSVLLDFGHLHKLYFRVFSTVACLTTYDSKNIDHSLAQVAVYLMQAQHNTRMLQTYAQIDDRVRILGYIMKVFAKVLVTLLE